MPVTNKSKIKTIFNKTNKKEIKLHPENEYLTVESAKVAEISLVTILYFYLNDHSF
jgi:hypothetical protein